MKKWLAMLLVILFTLPLVVGASAADDPVEITMWTFLDVANATSGRALALAKIIEEFEEQNPGVIVKVEPQDHKTLASKVYAAYAAGNTPDVFQVDVSNLGAGLQMGVMEPLENLFYADWSDEDKADVASGAWSVGVDEKGQHYQVALFGGVYGILYRADYFEKFGINVDDIKTWEDLYNAAEKLTFKDDNGMQVYGLGIGYSTGVTDANGILSNVLLNQEGGLFTQDGQPNQWDSEAAIQALQLELDAVNRGITPKNCDSLTYEDAFVAFSSGQYAMVFAPSLRIPPITAAASFDSSTIKFMAYPELEEGYGNASYSGGWFTCVSSISKNKEYAGKFLEFLCSSQADIIWVEVADQIPLRKSTVNLMADFIAQPGHEWLSLASNMKSDAYLPPATFPTTGMYEDFQNAFIRAYTENMDPTEALKSVQQDFIRRNSAR